MIFFYVDECSLNVCLGVRIQMEAKPFGDEARR